MSWGGLGVHAPMVPSTVTGVVTREAFLVNRGSLKFPLKGSPCTQAQQSAGGESSTQCGYRTFVMMQKLHLQFS